MQMTKTDAQGAKTGTSPTDSAALNPGDEAAPGTTGTGEDVCPDCHGKGRIDGAPCATCGGSGTVIRAVGGGWAKRAALAPGCDSRSQPPCFSNEQAASAFSWFET